MLIIHQWYSVNGGTEKATLLLTKHLEKMGHEIIIVHEDEPDSECKTFHSGRAYRIPELFDNSVWAKYKKAGFNELKKVIDKEAPDVIQIVFFNNSWIVKELAKSKPVIRVVHLPWMYCPGGVKFSLTKQTACTYPFGIKCIIKSITDRCAFTVERKPFSLLGVIRRVLECYQERGINRGLKKVVVNSHFTQQELIASGYLPKQICVVHPPVELHNELLTHVNDYTNLERTILYVGRLIPVKGVDYLIRAFALLHKDFQCRGKSVLTLIIAGDGPEKSRLEELSYSLGISRAVKFVGRLTSEGLVSYYKTCKLVVMPSLCTECFGLSGVEAMSYGKPVVAYNTGGIGEWLVDGVTGYLARPSDIKDLANKINIVLSNPDKAKEMGRIGREYANELFSVEHHTQRMLNLYEEVIRAFYN